MSLINKMLKDLDARQARAPDAGPMPDQIRVAPPSSRRNVPLAWVGIGVLLAAVAGAAGWTVLRPMLARHMSALPVAAAPTGKAPAPVSIPASAPVAAPTAAPVPVAAAMPASPAPAAVAEPARRPSPAVAAQSTGATTSSPPSREAKAATAAARVAEPGRADNDARAGGKAAGALPVTAAEAPPRSAAASPGVELLRKAPGLRPDTPAATGTGMTEAPLQAKVFTPQQLIENDYRKAVGWIQEGRLAEAATALEQVLRADPAHAAARQALIGVLIDSQRLDDAQKLARDGLAQDPAQPGLAMILARLQLEKGELRSAIETLERTQGLAPARADYQAFLAALLQRDNRHKDAVENYVLALRQNPQNGVWWMGLGISLQTENRGPEARDAYARAKSSGSLSPELQAFVDGRLRQLR